MRQTSSLLRNLCIHTYFRRSLQVAASPCWELVPDVISSKSFPGCLSPDPVGLQGATACFFPCIIGLPQVPPNGSASRIGPQRDFMRRVFRDRRYSLRSGLPVCSPPRSPPPLRAKGRRAAVTFPPEQLTHRYRCMHRVC